MEAPVVAVLSLKGGVGKTTVTLGIASAAMNEGRRGRSRSRPAVERHRWTESAREPEFSSSDVLYDGRTGVALDAITVTGWGPLVDCIPAERALEHRAMPQGADPGRRLQRALRGVRERYDLILLDCPPVLGGADAQRPLRRDAGGRGHRADLLRGTRSAAGGRGRRRGACRGQPGLSVVAIVPNRTRTTQSEHRYRLAELHDVFGDIVTEPIAERTAIQQAQGAGVAIHPGRAAARSPRRRPLTTCWDGGRCHRTDLAPGICNPGGTMINPPPRPALRKAPDADVHPVAAVPAAVVAVPTVVVAPTVHLAQAAGVASRSSGSAGRTSDTLVRKTPKKAKKTALEVKVPKSLLKSAAQVAKTRKTLMTSWCRRAGVREAELRPWRGPSIRSAESWRRSPQ